MVADKDLFLPNVEWIGSTDVRVVLALLDGIDSSGAQRSVLEVGVWKGSFCAAVLVNRPGATVLGIDPYPGNEPIRDSMFDYLSHLGVHHRFNLVVDWSDVHPNESFDLVHIDGLHTEDAVRRDLAEASRALRKGGVLVVDDIRHFWFPGIASAVYTFVANSDFRLLAMTPSKAYLARISDVEAHQSRLRHALGAFEDLVVSDFYGQVDGLPEAFAQRPAVRSVHPLLVHTNSRRRNKSVGAVIALVTPPLFMKAFTRVHKFFRQFSRAR